MSKLWEKDYALDTLIERFTVGEDFRLDSHLICSDCVASMAHAAMLAKIGIIRADEAEALHRVLLQIIGLVEDGEFPILIGDEDCHTAIEAFLTTQLGETGKKIHTGRSRNDQVIAALRLYTRDYLLIFQDACLQLAEVLLDFAGDNAKVPMPGRTHMQIAMPSSVGLWAAAFAEELLDELILLQAAYSLNNSCPLGSAASYGVPLPLDRKLVAELLGFDRVQNNVLYANNSRGKFESIVLDGVEQVMLTLSKTAQDLLLFSMPEFGYFSLPSELCPGSSIMPQKKNPGMLELIRAKTATVSGFNQQIKGVLRGLPSGYNRDFQETKAPFMAGIKIGLDSVRVMELVIRKLSVNAEALLRGFVPEIYATDRALELVAGGMAFRDAYREVGLNLDKLEKMDPHTALAKKNYPGTTGNLGLEPARQMLAEKRRRNEKEQQRITGCIQALTGRELRLYSA